MKKLFLLVAYSALQAGLHDNTLGNLQFSFSPGAMSRKNETIDCVLSGELGLRNLRGNFSMGVHPASCHRFKISGEWLTQKLNYEFWDSWKKKWTSQYALESEYQMLFPSEQSRFRSIEVGGGYSHAFFKNIQPQKFYWLGGSDGGFGFLGTTFQLWNSGYLKGHVDYDYLKYHDTIDAQKLSSGFGGEIRFFQSLWRDSLSLELGASFRKPFNYYDLSLNFAQNFSFGDANYSLYTNYTQGRYGLPDVLVGGISFNFNLGDCKPKNCCSTSCHSSDFESVPQSEGACVIPNCYEERLFCDLQKWISSSVRPLVPIVLTHAPQPTDCQMNPSLKPTSRAIPSTVLIDLVPNQQAVTQSIIPYFNSSLPLTFSMTILSTTGNFVGAVLQNGLLTTTLASSGVNSNATALLLIQATNDCGTTSQTVFFDFTFLGL